MKIEASHFHLEVDAAEIAEIVRGLCHGPAAYEVDASAGDKFSALRDKPLPSIDLGPGEQPFTDMIEAHGGEDDLIAVMDLNCKVLFVSDKHRALVDEEYHLKKVADELWSVQWGTPYNNFNSAVIDLQDLRDFDRAAIVSNGHWTTFKDRRCKAPGCIQTNAGGSVKPIFPPWGIQCEEWSGSNCTIQKVGGLVQHWPNDNDCPDDWNKWQFASVNAQGCWR